MKNKRNGNPFVNNLIRLIFLVMSISVVYPLYWGISTAFKTNQEFFMDPWSLPSRLMFDNFVRVWEKVGVSTAFMNSLVISLVVMALSVVLCSMTAYVCTRFGLRIGQKVVDMYMAFMFLPTIICATSVFLQMRDLNLLDNRLGLVLLYTANAAPSTVFLLSNFFRTLPHELEEAAYIDGSGLIHTFFAVMLPLAKPGMATNAIFNFLSAWGEYAMASILVVSPQKVPLQVALYSLQASSQHQADWTGLFAGMIIVMLPIIIIYTSFQKYITSGMTAGAIKG